MEKAGRREQRQSLLELVFLVLFLVFVPRLSLACARRSVCISALGFLLRGLEGVGVVTLSLERVLASASTEPGAVSDWYRSATERGLLRTTMSSSEKAAGERAPWERIKTGD